MSVPGQVEAQLRALGIELPQAAVPLGSYVPAVRSGNLVFLSGTLPMDHGQLTCSGKAGAEVSLEQAQAAARQAVIAALGNLQAEIGSLDRVRRIVRLEGHVASAPAFNEQSQVFNGASDLLAEIFGERGRHARLALGASELPLGATVELALIVEVTDQ